MTDWTALKKTNFLNSVQDTNLPMTVLAGLQGVTYRTAQGWAKDAGLSAQRTRKQYNRTHEPRSDKGISSPNRANGGHQRAWNLYTARGKWW